ncbi:hypothetical protein AgCh_021150 [Apium graveolens]
MNLEATDPDYLDVINDGPFMPTKLVPATPTVAEHYQLKEKTEWTPGEKVHVLKDAKDALETQCQGTMAIKKNRRVVLIQEYEHFETKDDESLTNIYDRFLTLLNNLSLVGKVYDREDSNTKFLRALSEEWETQTSIIRHQYDLDGRDMTGASRWAVEPGYPTGSIQVESDTDDSSSNPDDDTDSETDKNMTDSDVMQMPALLVKGFMRMQFRKSRNNRSFRKKFTRGEKKSTGRKDGKDSKAGNLDRTKIKGYNCDEPGHFASECKKTKHNKGKSKALITSSKNWIDSSDSEGENTCYARMASLDDHVASEPKVQTPFFSFDTENISELKSIFKSLHGSLKNKTLENDRLITEINTLKFRNDQLEEDLIHQIELKKECERAKHTVKILVARYSMLEKDLENERKTLKSWTDSGKKVHKMISKKKWKECLGYKDGIKDVDTENKISLKTPVKFISSEPDEPKSTFEKGSTSVSQEKLVDDKTQRKKSKETIKSVQKEKNIGLLSARKLKKKIFEVTNKPQVKSPKRNMNGKQCISKDSNYKVVPNASRKTCFNCGNTNHLAIDSRRNKKRKTVIPESDVRGHMTGNKSLLSEFEKKVGPDVYYGDGNVGHTLGYGNLIIRKVAIENVALVEGLKHNLLSISQITDRGYHVVFYDSHCEVVHNNSKKIVLIGYRHGNIYEARLYESLEKEATCLISKASVDESWNWHKKLSHLNFNSINELAKKELVRGLPNMLYSSDGLCDAFQKSKQRRVSFKSKT